MGNDGLLENRFQNKCFAILLGVKQTQVALNHESLLDRHNARAALMKIKNIIKIDGFRNKTHLASFLTVLLWFFKIFSAASATRFL